MMRLKGKKPIFTYKDTWDLSHVLNPILTAGLKKYKEVAESEENCAGYPSGIWAELGEERVEGKEDEYLAMWHSFLDKMIYSFGAKEPDIMKYNIEWEDGPNHGDVCEGGLIRCDMVVANPEEHDRYDKDMREHSERVQEGLDLFAKYYNSLWW